jgi:ATP-dependent protease ClpP protease subunit
MRDLKGLVMLAQRGAQIRAANGSNSGERFAYRITNAGERTTIHLYDDIGEWGVTARDFVAELAGIGKGGIDLHINSGGGDVFDGVAMHAALVNHPSSVTAYIDGIAASAASFIAMAGDEVVIEKHARMMIHEASGIALGNKRDFREAADVLEGIDGTMAQMYADRAGGKPAEWLTRMEATTWFGSQAAVDIGLADRVANDNSSKEAAPEDRRGQLIRARARVALRG